MGVLEATVARVTMRVRWPGRAGPGRARPPAADAPRACSRLRVRRAFVRAFCARTRASACAPREGRPGAAAEHVMQALHAMGAFRCASMRDVPACRCAGATGAWSSMRIRGTGDQVRLHPRPAACRGRVRQVWRSRCGSDAPLERRCGSGRGRGIVSCRGARLWRCGWHAARRDRRRRNAADSGAAGRDPRAARAVPPRPGIATGRAPRRRRTRPHGRAATAAGRLRK